jgi:hypothetical protein
MIICMGVRLVRRRGEFNLPRGPVEERHLDRRTGGSGEVVTVPAVWDRPGGAELVVIRRADEPVPRVTPYPPVLPTDPVPVAPGDGVHAAVERRTAVKAASAVDAVVELDAAVILDAGVHDAGDPVLDTVAVHGQIGEAANPRRRVGQWRRPPRPPHEPGLRTVVARQCRAGHGCSIARHRFVHNSHHCGAPVQIGRWL